MAALLLPPWLAIAAVTGPVPQRVAVCFAGQFPRGAAPSARAHDVFGLRADASVDFDAYVATSDAEHEVPPPGLSQARPVNASALALHLRRRCGFSRADVSTEPYDPVPHAHLAARVLRVPLCCRVGEEQHAWMPHRVVSWFASVQRCARMIAREPRGTYDLVLLTRLDVWDALRVSPDLGAPGGATDDGRARKGRASTLGPLGSAGSGGAATLALASVREYDAIAWRQRGVTKDQALLLLSERLWSAGLASVHDALPGLVARALGPAAVASGAGCEAVVPEALLRQHLDRALPSGAARFLHSRRALHFKVPIFRAKHDAWFARAVRAQLECAAAARAARGGEAGREAAAVLVLVRDPHAWQCGDERGPAAAQPAATVERPQTQCRPRRPALPATTHGEYY